MTMAGYLRNHLLSLALIAGVTITAISYLQKNTGDATPQPPDDLKPYLEMSEIDFNDPFQQELFKDLYPLYNRNKSDRSARQTMEAILDYQRAVMEYNMRVDVERQILDMAKFRQILPMYFKFILVYLIVLILTYYGVETLGLLRFIRNRQKKVSYLYELIKHLNTLQKFDSSAFIKIVKLLIKAGLRGALYLILFSPAYVLAYSIKTEFNTNTILFLVLLGFICNGLLITYANKFYSFLINESRKGYVDTARVKNLDASFRFREKSALSFNRLLALRKRFPGHILDHIYQNAHTQYFSALKEQANFLISGLIIIEMALNIHGHFSYELLQQLLYKNYDIVALMVFGLFLVVKCTQIATDWQISRLYRRYGNLTENDGKADHV